MTWDNFAQNVFNDTTELLFIPGDQYNIVRLQVRRPIIDTLKIGYISWTKHGYCHIDQGCLALLVDRIRFW